MHGDLEYPLPPKERAFLDAAKEGQVARLRELIADGVPVDVLDNRELPCWGQTALMHTARGGHLEAVKYLLASGAKVSAKDRGDMESEHNRQPLHYAMQSRNIAVAEALLDAHASPNAVSYLGFTPLNVAIQEDNAEAVGVLLRRGADVNLKPRTKRYTPPIREAVVAGKPALLRLLLEAGADANAPDSLNETPLMYVGSVPEACAVAMFNDLVKAGANVDHIGNGRTALLMAVLHCNHGTVKGLLQAGANVNLVYETHQGTVLDVVEQRVQTHQKEVERETNRSPLSIKLLPQWQATLGLLREFGAKRMRELPGKETNVQ